MVSRGHEASVMERPGVHVPGVVVKYLEVLEC